MIWLALVLAALVTVGWLCRRLEDNPRQTADCGLLMAVARVWARFFHRLRVQGREHVPGSRFGAGPLLVVANHTAGADPLLIQVACPFEIRWMMAADMRHPGGEAFWRWAGIIFIDRKRPDLSGLRRARRHLEAGGVLGIFPEGRIERPAEQLLPFQRGVGTLVSATGARVLPVIVRGTPSARTAWGSLFRFGRARLEFLPVVAYDRGTSAEHITADLQHRFERATGWRVNMASNGGNRNSSAEPARSAVTGADTDR